MVRAAIYDEIKKNLLTELDRPPYFALCKTLSIRYDIVPHTLAANLRRYPDELYVISVSEMLGLEQRDLMTKQTHRIVREAAIHFATIHSLGELVKRSADPEELVLIFKHNSPYIATYRKNIGDHLYPRIQEEKQRAFEEWGKRITACNSFLSKVSLVSREVKAEADQKFNEFMKGKFPELVDKK